MKEKTAKGLWKGLSHRNRSGSILIQYHQKGDRPTLQGIYYVAQGVAMAKEVRQAVYREVPHGGDVVVELNTNHFARLRGKLR